MNDALLGELRKRGINLRPKPEPEVNPPHPAAHLMHEPRITSTDEIWRGGVCIERNGVPLPNAQLTVESVCEAAGATMKRIRP